MDDTKSIKPSFCQPWGWRSLRGSQGYAVSGGALRGGIPAAPSLPPSDKLQLVSSSSAGKAAPPGMAAEQTRTGADPSLLFG